MASVADADIDAKSEETDADEDPLKVGRRLIYLHRLVGDDVLTPKTKTSRPNPWRVTIVFLFYAICSSIAVLSFTDVALLADSNIAIEKALRDASWQSKGGSHKTFENISRAHEVIEYINYGILPKLILHSGQSEKNSILSFNKVLHQPGFCSNVAVLVLTMRKMKTSTKHKETTTARFSPLYPETWKGANIEAGQWSNKHEEKGTLWHSYQYPASTTHTVPETHLGWSVKYGTNLSTKMTYRKLEASDDRTVWTKWEYTPECKSLTGSSCKYSEGYEGRGGYVAAITVRTTKAEMLQIDSYINASGMIDWPALSHIVSDQYVYLLSPGGSSILNPSNGSCTPGVTATNVMRFEDFKKAVFIDDTSATVSLDFMTYNPNKQSVSRVVANWNVYPMGLVIVPNVFKIQTIKLDLKDTYYLVWEVFYIIGTCFYFIELFIYKGVKYKHKIFGDIWTYVNAISIICSVASVGLRYHYTSTTNQIMEDTKSETYDQNSLNKKFLDQIDLSNGYQVFSAVALLTIWLRVVELLARTPPRVKLLEATLIKALGNMALYFLYILVIIVGFWSFASVHFCSHSLDFISPGKAFISVFELLCLNVLPYKSTGGAPLRRLFFFPYMAFGIISVQMFNSIINYAYNRVSEDMEPVFRRAAREKKSKERTQKSSLSIVLRYLRLSWGWCKDKIGIKRKTEDDASKSMYEKRVVDADVVTEEDMAPGDKEKVENFKETLQKKQATESGCAFIMYVIFAASYIIFMWLALNITKNGSIAASVSQVVHDARISKTHTHGAVQYFNPYDVTNIQDLALWMTYGLPKFVYGSDEEGTPGAESEYGNVCMHNWNCFVAGFNGSWGSGASKIVRVTQRLQKRVENFGLAPLDPERPLREGRCHGCHRIVPVRGPVAPLSAEGSNDGLEDRTTDMTMSASGTPFCRREPNGGYRDQGGIVCLLDADRGNMTLQLATMATSGFYSLATGTITADMVLYNGNSDSVVYVALEFTLAPSGAVELTDRVETFSILPVHHATDDKNSAERAFNVGKNLVKPEYLFGIVYTFLTFYFIYRMGYELQIECHRRMVNDGTGRAMSTYAFFAKDFFHILDVISYVFSIASVVFFIFWLHEQMDIRDRAVGSFSEFLTFIGEMQKYSRRYTIVSSANLLIICVRPLKYFRTDPRMAKINATFSEALEDILWFNVMLLFFFIGFVLFAYLIFGIKLESYSTIGSAAVACFGFLLGQFDFWVLWKVKDWAAIFFVFTFLFLFKFFFLNVFFAIIDKFFVSGEPPPLNLKRTLKPALSRLIRWVEWDDDYTMNNQDQVEKERPISRAGRVHKVAMLINEIKMSDGHALDDEGYVRKSKELSDVCDVDEKMSEVMRWSREEAKRFVEYYRTLQVQKQEFRNDDVFLKNKVKVAIDKELAANQEAMEEAERHRRYAILVNEAMEIGDQDVLSKYILRLEDKITKKMIEKHALLTDVYHLRAESEKMRYTDDDIKHIADEETLQQDKEQIEDADHGGIDIEDDASSNGEYAQAPEDSGVAGNPGQPARLALAL